MGIIVGSSVPMITVFLQGILSFFSPCVFPLIPVYVGYLSGGTGRKGEDGRMIYDRKKVLCNTFFFVLGISFAFFMLALGMNALGSFFSGNRLLFARIGGVIIFLFGLYQLGLLGNSMILSGVHQLPVKLENMKMSPVTALIMGFVISFAWTPCVGPTLSSVLIMAGSAASRAQGFLLIGIYTLGYVIPFMLVGLFTTSILGFFSKHRGIVRYTVKAGGVLMLLMGALMFTGKMNSITGYLSALSSDSGLIKENISGTEEIAVSVSEAQFDESSVVSSDVLDSNADSYDDLTKDRVEKNTKDSIKNNNEKNTKDSIENNNEKNTEENTVDRTEDSTEESVEESTVSETESTESEESVPDYEVVPAPDFTLTDQYGETHSLSDYRGKIVFMNFWATWCPPCRGEMPDIEKLYRKYSEDPESDVAILGVASPGNGREKDIEGVKSFLKDNGYTFPTVMDRKGELLSSYYITAFPTTFILDDEGNVLGFIPGAMTEDIMEDVIRQAKEIVAAKG